MPIYHRRIFLVVFCMLIFSLIGLQDTYPAETAIIKIRFREASGLLPIVETMLSPEGRAVVDVRTNAIIIVDEAESLKRIRKFLTHFDKPVQQVRIRFRFQEEGVSNERDVSVSGKVSGKKWSLSAGKMAKEGVRVRARDKSVDQRRKSESFITVLSGSAAYILVGKKIPYTERWVYLSRRYARFTESVAFQRIETGMEVRPVVSGDRVHVEITPRVSYEEEGKKGVIRFTEASTKLSVPRGQWVTLGGRVKKAMK